MSSKNQYIEKSKVAAGAALVALSAFVPQPLIHEASAASTTVKVTGKFVTGITLSATADVGLGSVIAQASTGFLQMKADAATATSNGTFVGTPTVGKIKITAAAKQPIDIKVAGFGKLTLTGAGATGTATLTKVYFGGTLTGSATATGGTATATATATGAVLKNTVFTAAPGTITVGSRIVWTGNVPVGTFDETLTVTITY